MTTAAKPLRIFLVAGEHSGDALGGRLMYAFDKRLGSGVVDLVYDLRTLADLCRQHGKSDAVGAATAGAVEMALAAADAIEFALRVGEPAADAQRRNTLGRLWTLFVPAYDRAAAGARTLTRGEGRERRPVRVERGRGLGWYRGAAARAAPRAGSTGTDAIVRPNDRRPKKRA